MPKRIDRYEAYWREILVAATLADAAGEHFAVTIPSTNPRYTQLRFYGFREAARRQGIPGDRVLDRLTPRLSPDGHGVTLTWVGTSQADAEVAAAIAEQLRKYTAPAQAPQESPTPPAKPAETWLDEVLRNG
jgi:hypothetical protein